MCNSVTETGYSRLSFIKTAFEGLLQGPLRHVQVSCFPGFFSRWADGPLLQGFLFLSWVEALIANFSVLEMDLWSQTVVFLLLMGTNVQDQVEGTDVGPL